jgi:hypothetical protein
LLHALLSRWTLQGLTENQRRLLYLISLYSHPAETGGDKERWIRRSTALVLLYEGIVAQVLDYDYAPSSEIVESRRMYFNMSQVLEVQVSNMMPHQSESPWLPLHLTLGPTHE